MTAKTPGQKTFLIDANLLAPYQTRVFIGHLAEHGRAVIGGTPYVMLDVLPALHRIMRSRRHAGAVEQEAVGRNLDAIEKWMSHYRAQGIWRDWSPEDYRADTEALEAQGLLEEQWARMKTDEEDFHLAEAAVLCGIDGLCSANMNMISDEDWQALMSTLGLPDPPALCRREAIVDRLSGCPGLGQDPEAVLGVILPVMRAAEDLKSPLLIWSREIKPAFPKLSEGLGKVLSGMSEETLQRIRQEGIGSSWPPGAPITRNFLSLSP